MDIEGFTRQALEENDEKQIQERLQDKILEYKRINPEIAADMALAVIEEVKSTLTIKDHPDKDLQELIGYPEAGVAMGEMGVGSRGEGDFFVHRRIAEIVKSTHTAAARREARISLQDIPLGLIEEQVHLDLDRIFLGTVHSPGTQLKGKQAVRSR